MKKALNISLLIALTAALTVGFYTAFDKDKEDVSRSSVQGKEIPVSVRYSGATPFQGPDFTTAAERSVHAVVHIRSEFLRRSAYDDIFAPFREFFGEPYQRGNQVYSGFGSGVIISDDGFIVTNNHVVEGSNFLEVTLNDKRTFDAEIIGRDPSTDLALIKIKENNLPYVAYGNSDEVVIGEWVLAVGNPFNLTSTVTAGIVSAKARNINILGSPGALESFIQFDAAVNRGNSGGALVNTRGELIGINAAIASSTGAFAGYSFAIPVNIVRKVVDDLLNYGQVQRAYLGVVIREITSSFAEEKGLQGVRGVYVDRTAENSGAEAAGIKSGDVILSIDGTSVNTVAQLLEVVGQHKPGDMVSVSVMRDEKEKMFRVELRNEEGTTDVTRKEEEFFISDLGASFEEITAEDMRRLNINYGLKVIKIKDGLLKNGGIKEDFIITEINEMKIRTKQDLKYALDNLRGSRMKIDGVYPNGMRMSYGFLL